MASKPSFGRVDVVRRTERQTEPLQIAFGQLREHLEIDLVLPNACSYRFGASAPYCSMVFTHTYCNTPEINWKEHELIFSIRD